MNPDRNFLDQFNIYFDKINHELSNSLQSDIPLIEDIGRHSLLAEGKRLRPLLFILSSKLCHYNRDDIYRFSTIFEYIHVASLLHDDVLDNADTRRKRASANRLWGNSAAVLVGDFFSAMSTLIALRSNKIEFLEIISRASSRMVEGQVLELAHTHDWSISKSEYMKIISSKTAALMAAACECGAVISGADSEAVRCLGEFGFNLGIAFQLIDDLLDYTSSEEAFGKPVGKDLREGKITLPLIYTLLSLKEEEVERLSELFKNENAKEEDHTYVINMVRSNGVVDRIRSEAEEYVDRAADSLNFFPGSSIRDELKALNDYMVKRHY